MWCYCSNIYGSLTQETALTDQNRINGCIWHHPPLYGEAPYTSKLQRLYRFEQILYINRGSYYNPKAFKTIYVIKIVQNVILSKER